jgi:hypothetical protein
MASTRQLEENLPPSAPPIPDGDYATRKIAIYTTLSLDATQLKQLEQDLRDADDISDTPVTQLAPQPFSENLLDIYNHHLQMDSQDSPYHPRCFIVADQNDWKEKGVLFVNLAADTEQRESFVGVCRCDLEMATQIEANLDIGNMDWVDYKEMEENDFGGENPYKNPRYYPLDPTA